MSLENDEYHEHTEKWFTETVLSYEQPLLKFAYGICHDEELAKDVVQDTFLKMAKELRRNHIVNVGAWLFTVCQNLLTDFFRKSQRQKTESLTQQEDTLTSKENSPDYNVILDEEKKFLISLIEELPEKSQMIVRLRFFSKMSQNEIASVTGLKSGYVGYILHHALKDMRIKWEKYRNE